MPNWKQIGYWLRSYLFGREKVLKIAMFFPKVTFNTFQTKPYPNKTFIWNTISRIKLKPDFLFNYLDIEDSAYRIEADETKLMLRRIESFDSTIFPPFE